MVALLYSEAAAAVGDDDAMESADPEFPAPVDPPAPAAADFPVSTEETSVAPSKSSSRPRIPVVYYRLRPKARLRALSEYICSFDYWLSPHTNFNSQKNRPLCLIMETAKLVEFRNSWFGMLLCGLRDFSRTFWGADCQETAAYQVRGSCVCCASSHGGAA